MSATKGATTIAQVVGTLEDIETLLAWSCQQISAQVAGALALLPDRDQIWRGPALSDRIGDSPDQRARMRLARTIETVRTLLDGIKSHSEGLHNDIDCSLETMCEQLGVLTRSRAERARTMAIAIAAQRPPGDLH